MSVPWTLFSNFDPPVVWCQGITEGCSRRPHPTKTLWEDSDDCIPRVVPLRGSACSRTAVGSGGENRLAAPAGGQDDPGDESDGQHGQRLGPRNLCKHVGKARRLQDDDLGPACLVLRNCIWGKRSLVGHWAARGLGHKLQPGPASLVPFSAEHIARTVVIPCAK